VEAGFGMGFDYEIRLEPNRGWREWGRWTLIHGCGSISTQSIDAKVTHRHGIHATLVGRALKCPAYDFYRVSRIFRNANEGYLFLRHSPKHGMHCGPFISGCYQPIASGFHRDQLACRQSDLSDISCYTDVDSAQLRYEDGGTFIDGGCGSGQNTRFLATCYPPSAVIATDINADAAPS